MKYWSTSEAAMDVSPLFFNKDGRVGAMMSLEAAMNKHLPKVDTGEWVEWLVIFMIVNEAHIRDLKFRELRRLTQRDKTLHFRVFVEHKPATTADFPKCVDLLVTALERTLPYFSKAKISKTTQEQIRSIIHLAADEAKASASAKH